jgi:hypothetical protein
MLQSGTARRRRQIAAPAIRLDERGNQRRDRGGQVPHARDELVSGHGAEQRVAASFLADTSETSSSLSNSR